MVRKDFVQLVFKKPVQFIQAFEAENKCDGYRIGPPESVAFIKAISHNVLRFHFPRVKGA